MTNNKSVTIQTYRQREPLTEKTVIKIDGESGKDIAKVHSVSAFTKITNREALESEMIISGETTVFALYETDNGDWVECKGETTWETKTLLLGANALVVTPHVQACEVLGFDSSEITVNCLQNLLIKEVVNEEVSVEIEETVGLEKDQDVVNISKVSGVSSGAISLEYEIDISDFENATLLSRNVEAIIDNTFAGVDTVTVSGNINVNLTILESDQIKNITKSFPFKNEIECFGASPANIIDAVTYVSKVMAGIREKEQNAGVIALDVELESSVITFENEEVNIIKDAYCAFLDTSLSVESVNIKKLNNVSFGSVNVDFSVDLQDKLNVDEVVSIINPKLEISTVSVQNGDCELNGFVNLSVIYNNNNENSIQSFAQVCPFTVNFNVDEEFNILDDFKIIINSFKLKAGREIQVDADIVYTLKNEKDDQISYVSNIEYAENEVNDNVAIKVYTVKEGEKVFDIAKNLGVTISNLLAQNPDLESGIVAGEKVYVYIPQVINFND